jgi:hypothetical protein
VKTARDVDEAAQVGYSTLVMLLKYSHPLHANVLSVSAKAFMPHSCQPKLVFMKMT